MASIGGTLEMARESYAVAYVTAVCATTLLFDYCLTFSDELGRIWPTSFSVPKFLFLVDRYVVLPMLVCVASSRDSMALRRRGTTFHLACVFYLRWLVVCVTVTNATIEGILLMRVIALYRQNIPVVVFSSMLYIAGIGMLIGLSVKDYAGESVQIVQDFSALPGCYAASVPSIVAGYWIISTVVESVFCILVVYRVVIWSRNNVSVSPALILMARDSIVYFALIFALLIVNLFVFEYAPPFLSSLFVTPASTAGCIAGARMLMNLRAFAARDASTTDSEVEMTGFSALRFGRSTETQASRRAAIVRGKSSFLSTAGTTASASTKNVSGVGSKPGWSGSLMMETASMDTSTLPLPVLSFVLDDGPERRAAGAEETV